MSFPAIPSRLAIAAVFATLSLTGAVFAAEFTILPLGDSITAGDARGGYRARLVADLTDAGHTVHLLGSQTMPDGGETPASLRPPHDGLHHEGHGGWRLGQLDDNLDGDTDIDQSGHGGHFITGRHGTGRPVIEPDFILLLAGINDINQSFGASEKAGEPMDAGELMPILQDRVTALVAKLHELTPRSHILLGTVIPYANGLLNERITGATKSQREIWAGEDGVTPEQEAGVNHYVILYNKWLADEFVPAQKASGVTISLVDQYRNFILPDGKVRGWGPDAPDGYIDFGLHPNPHGYDLMGATWADAINRLVR